MIIITGLFLIVSTLVLSSAEIHPLSDDFINMINTRQNSWRAGRNFPRHTTLDTIKKLMGVIEDHHIEKLALVVHDDSKIANLPETFDPRDKWPNCPTLNEIRDEGSCRSGWVFGAVEAMTDRYCIYSNGTQQFHFSAEDLLSCCNDCGSGCKGGMPIKAWLHWQRSGIVSGGNYNTSQGCRPYTIPPCEHRVSTNSAPCGDNVRAPDCKTNCIDGYPKTYEEDKRYGKNVYCIQSKEEQIRAELYENGPVEALLGVYEDFLSYKSGVYRHTNGSFLKYQSVKMLGWGVENGNKYWLIANSWNAGWGENGFFKIVRGEDHCYIESRVLAGEPLVKN